MVAHTLQLFKAKGS